MRTYFSKIVDLVPDKTAPSVKERVLKTLEGLFDAAMLTQDDHSVEAAAALVVACAAVSRMPEPKESKKLTKKLTKKKGKKK